MKNKFVKTLIVIGLSVISVLPICSLFISSKYGFYDWDWFFSHYEALRVSVVHYRQFPWFNPWSAGGVPLYGEPQLGILSPTTLLVVVFGTLWGLKIAVVTYFLLGLWGIYFLLRHLGSRHKSSTFLLSIVWVYSSFITFHIYVGHVSFLQYLLVPWAILVILKTDYKGWWLIAGLVWGVFILSVPHYISLQLCVFVPAFILYKLSQLTNYERRIYVVSMMKFITIAALIALPKLYYSAMYTTAFPDRTLAQTSLGMWGSIKSFLSPQNYNTLNASGLGSWETGAYSGLGFIFLSLASFVLEAYRATRRKINKGYWYFLLLGFLAFIVGAGSFFKLAPYTLLSRLPVFSSMQVPSRWFGWSILFVIIAVSYVKFPSRPIKAVLLAMSVVEIVLINVLVQHPPFTQDYTFTADNKNFQQYSLYTQPIKGEVNTFFAVRNNYGEVRSYEPILSTFERKTARCGINEGCPYVKGATLISWSPNEMRLKGIAGQKVEINANASNAWLVNGKRISPDEKVINILGTLEFNMPDSGDAVVSFSPKSRWLLITPFIGIILGIGLLVADKSNINSRKKIHIHR